MSLTLDMSKFNCVVAGRRLKNISLTTQQKEFIITLTSQ